jgi:uncharacterized protein YbjQ (UPF0145 family)
MEMGEHYASGERAPTEEEMKNIHDKVLLIHGAIGLKDLLSADGKSATLIRGVHTTCGSTGAHDFEKAFTRLMQQAKDLGADALVVTNTTFIEGSAYGDTLITGNALKLSNTVRGRPTTSGGLA